MNNRCDFCGLIVCKCSTFNELGKKLSRHIQEGLHKYLPGCYFGPDEVYELLMDKYKVIEALECAEGIIANYQMDIDADNSTIYKNALSRINKLKNGERENLE